MKALIVVDMQIDFSSKGTLPVYKMEKLLPKLNLLMSEFAKNKDLVVATKDWHPDNHISFYHSGTFQDETKPYDDVIKDHKNTVAWPKHCVKNTPGADFVPDLQQRYIDKIIYKGVNTNKECYSGFINEDDSKETGLNKFLKENGVPEVHIVGVATDFCVNETVLDAIRFGYKTYVHQDIIMGIDNSQKNLEKIFENWLKKGVILLEDWVEKVND